MKIEVLPMTIIDLEEIAENLTEDFDDFWSASVLKNELENPHHLSSYYFVAKMNLEIVGFCGVSKIVDTLEVLNIVTKKDRRNSGIASFLLQHMIDFAKASQINIITLEVNEHNLPAIHLYEKYHFQQVGIRKKYYHGKDDAILMNLTINA
ncbi:MAG: ribosomal protein S18-alanine N-acetyltransferase [Clostridia bacterium]|nr:ribosomal protein S18-alanine N-acetyltransferase [Clostridia bacterium]